MNQWEYLTRFLEAQVRSEDKEMLQKRFNKNRLPKYSPEAMIPELDQLGAAGWELVHMEPVAKVGGKGDVLFPSGPRWSNSYFCVFKRPKTVVSAAAPQPQAMSAPPPPPPMPTASPMPDPSPVSRTMPPATPGNVKPEG